MYDWRADSLRIIASLFIIFLLIYIMSMFILIEPVDYFVSNIIKYSNQANITLGAILAILIHSLPVLLHQTRKISQAYYYRKRWRYHGHTYAYYRGAPAEDQW